MSALTEKSREFQAEVQVLGIKKKRLQNLPDKPVDIKRVRFEEPPDKLVSITSHPTPSCVISNFFIDLVLHF